MCTCVWDAASVLPKSFSIAVFSALSTSLRFPLPVLSGQRLFSHYSVGIIFQTAAYGESLFLFRDVNHDSLDQSACVYGGVIVLRDFSVCNRVLWVFTCLFRCPVDCWVAERAGRCLCCGQSSCHNSSSHLPTQQTGPGYLQDRADTSVRALQHIPDV